MTMRKIASTLIGALIEDGRRVVPAAFDTLMDGRHTVVGITVGTLTGPRIEDVRCSATGLLVIRAMGEHAARNGWNAPLGVFGVSRRTGVAERIAHVLRGAPEHAGVLLVCADGEIYDAAFRALNVDEHAVPGAGTENLQ